VRHVHDLDCRALAGARQFIAVAGAEREFNGFIPLPSCVERGMNSDRGGSLTSGDDNVIGPAVDCVVTAIIRRTASGEEHR